MTDGDFDEVAPLVIKNARNVGVVPPFPIHDELSAAWGNPIGAVVRRLKRAALPHFVSPPIYRAGMRILHTSDWHLGRSFHREDLLGAQARFIDFLVDTVRTEKVEVVVVAGDVYDRALPPVDAVSLCNEALTRVVDTGSRIVMISGNHDSARRLGFGSGLLDSAGVHLRTDPRSCGIPVLIDDRHGPVAFYAIPYLEPDAVRDSFECIDRSHDAVLSAAMAAARADLRHRRTTRSVAVAHAFVNGAASSDSERDIRVGGSDAVAPAVFAGMDYVALGHLHGPQTLRAPGTTAMRYSGSPLAYSFSEASHTKTVSLIALDENGVTTIDALPCPVPRALAHLRGDLDDLLGDPTLSGHEGSWLSVVLTDPTRPQEPMERLRRRFPHVLALSFEPRGASGRVESSYVERLRGRDDVGIAAGFVEHVRGTAADDAELGLLRDALEHAARLDATAGA